MVQGEKGGTLLCPCALDWGDWEHSLGHPPGWVSEFGCQHPLKRARKHSPVLAKVVPDGFAVGKEAAPPGMFCMREREVQRVT